MFLYETDAQSVPYEGILDTTIITPKGSVVPDTWRNIIEIMAASTINQFNLLYDTLAGVIERTIVHHQNTTVMVMLGTCLKIQFQANL